MTCGISMPYALGIDYPIEPAPKWRHKRWRHKLSGFVNPLKELWDRAMDGHAILPQMADHIEHQKEQDTATLTSFIIP